MHDTPDEATQQLAVALGLTVEAYLAKVNAYRLDPTREVSLEVDEDAPEPEGGVEAILASADATPDFDDAFERPRARVVVF